MAMPAPYTGRKPYVFVSYCHYDGYRVEPIIERMAEDGYRVFYHDGRQPGCDWDDTTVARIEACSCAVFMLSSAHLNATGCIDAVINVAQDKPRLSVMLEWVTPPDELQKLPAIDHYDYIDIDSFFKELYRFEPLAACLRSCVHDCAPDQSTPVEKAGKTAPSASLFEETPANAMPVGEHIPPVGERWVDEESRTADRFAEPIAPPLPRAVVKQKLWLIPAVLCGLIGFLYLIMTLSNPDMRVAALLFCNLSALCFILGLKRKWPLTLFGCFRFNRIAFAVIWIFVFFYLLGAIA